MKKNTLILLGTILLGLVAISAAPKIFKQDENKRIQTENLSVDMSDFSKESVSQISFGKDDEMKNLKLENNEWKINGEKADQAKVDFFFEELKEAEVMKQASKNDQNHKKFQVTPEEGTTLKIYNDDGENIYYVGKIGPSIDTFYIRKKGIKNVYLMESGFGRMLSWLEDEWKVEEEDGSPQQNDAPREDNGSGIEMQ